MSRVAAKLATVLESVLAVAQVWRQQLNALLRHSVVEVAAVVGTVGDDPLQLLALRPRYSLRQADSSCVSSRLRLSDMKGSRPGRTPVAAVTQ